MKRYRIPAGTIMWRRQTSGTFPSGHWERLTSSKAVVYTSDEVVGEHESPRPVWIHFQLPEIAKPWTVLEVETKHIVIEEE